MDRRQSPRSRKQLGAYATPQWLVDLVVAEALADLEAGPTVTVLDPACGDGRFLAAAGRRLRAAGYRPVLRGVDVDAAALDSAGVALAGFGDVDLRAGDALAIDLGDGTIDVVVGNPPFLSQLATATTRGGASGHGGGPYADAAAEFLALSIRAVRPGTGRVGLVLPQSVLASRDAAAVRHEVDRLAERRWAWWSPQHVFDAGVLVCALVLARRSSPSDGPAGAPWTDVVTSPLGVPPLPPLRDTGTLGDRARLSANFRDHYYALVPAVVDGADGPPFVTSGLLDPGRCRWGQRPVTFARRRHARPCVDRARLAPWMQPWADGLLVPKVLVANQTRVVEAVVDAGGAWLPGVPVLAARPSPGVDPWAVGAVLTSPVATTWAWHRAAGTGRSASSLRLGPRWLADLPWPVGGLGPAIDALRAGDVSACARAATRAYGVDPADPVVDWWDRHRPLDA